MPIHLSRNYRTDNDNFSYSYNILHLLRSLILHSSLKFALHFPYFFRIQDATCNHLKLIELTNKRTCPYMHIFFPQWTSRVAELSFKQRDASSFVSLISHSDTTRTAVRSGSSPQRARASLESKYIVFKSHYANADICHLRPFKRAARPNENRNTATLIAAINSPQRRGTRFENCVRANTDLCPQYGVRYLLRVHAFVTCIRARRAPVAPRRIIGAIDTTTH